MAIDLTFNANFESLFAGMKQTESNLISLQETTDGTTKTLQEGVKKSTDEQNKFNKSVKDTANSAAAAAGSATKVADSFGKLAIQQGQVIAKQKQLEQELQKAIAAGIKAAETYGKDSAEAQKYAKIINDLTNQIKQLNPPLDDVEQGFTSLKTQLREAKNEAQLLAQEFGVNSEQAVAAQKRVADLADEIGDFNARVDALNPDKKFAIVGQLAQGVAGGFAAAQGALALFGEESEDVQKALLKVQAALALSQGINSVLEMKDTFKSLGAVLGLTTTATAANTAATTANATAAVGATGAIVAETAATGGATVATNAFTAALLANPFTAIAVGLTAIIALLVTFADEAEEAGKSYIGLSETLKQADDLTEEQFKLRGDLRKKEIELLEAQGASSKKLTDARIDDITREIAAQRALITLEQERMDNADSIRNSLSASDEAKKQAQSDYVALQKSIEQRKSQVELMRKDIQIINAKFNSDEIEAEKEKNEKIKQEREKMEKELLEIRKHFLDLTTQAEYDNFSEREKIVFDFTKKLSELELAFKAIPKPDLNDKTRYEKAISDINDQFKKALEEFNLKNAPEIEVKVGLKRFQSIDTDTFPPFVDRLNAELLKAAKDGKFSIANVLFPFNDDEQRALIDQKLSSIASSVQDAFNSLIQLQEEDVQRRKKQNEDLLNDLQTRISATESALKEEVELQRQGYASNVKNKQEELRKLKEEEAKALLEKKRIAEEEKKIAREKALASSIEAGAKMTVAVATLFADGALKGPAGVITAIATVAALVATFLSIKAQLQAAQNFEEGGQLPFGLVKGKRHSRGGERIGSTNIFVEGGEYVSSIKTTDKYGNLLDDLNKNKTSAAGYEELKQVLIERGIKMNDTEIKKTAANKIELQTAQAVIIKNESGKEIQQLKKDFNSFTEKYFSDEKTEIMPDGSTHIIKGSVTTIIRK